MVRQLHCEKEFLFQFPKLLNLLTVTKCLQLFFLILIIIRLCNNLSVSRSNSTISQSNILCRSNDIRNEQQSGFYQDCETITFGYVHKPLK